MNPAAAETGSLFARATVAACVLFALSGLAMLGQPTHPDRAAPRVPLQWGLYQILWSREYGAQLTEEASKFASPPDYVMFYRDLGRSYPKFPIDRIRERSATPVVSLELWSWHGEHDGSYLPLINRGTYDSFFRQWARDAKADGRTVLLRFGFEFNGNWFTWSRDPEGYVAAWRRVRRIFDEVGAANVKWVWAPNVVSCPDTPQNQMHLYYPGDDFVDFVGVDGYNFGEHHDQWHHWQSFEEVFADTLSDLSRRYDRKSLIITETGCAPGQPGQRSRWIREAHRYLLSVPAVKAVIWFNYDKRREGEPNWRIDVTPESLRAFNETFAAPRVETNVREAKVD